MVTNVCSSIGLIAVSGIPHSDFALACARMGKFWTPLSPLQAAWSDADG